MAAFASSAFAVAAFSVAAFSFDAQTPEVPAVTGGGGFAYHHLYRYKGKTPEEIRAERVKLGIFPAEVLKVAETSTKQAIETRKVWSEAQELAEAERAMRERLEAMRREWLDEYSQLLAALYAQYEQENEDAQIAMLLFDM